MATVIERMRTMSNNKEAVRRIYADKYEKKRRHVKMNYLSLLPSDIMMKLKRQLKMRKNMDANMYI